MLGRRWIAIPVVVLILTISISTAAWGEPLIYIDPPATEMHPDTLSCWVDVVINDEVLGLTGFDLEINYDETLLELLDVDEGPLPGSNGDDTFFFWTQMGIPSDGLLIQGAVLGASVDGPGILASLQFGAVTPIVGGTSPVDFVWVDLRDIANAAIAVTPENGAITVPVSPVESASWTRVKAFYR